MEPHVADRVANQRGTCEGRALPSVEQNGYDHFVCRKHAAHERLGNAMRFYLFSIFGLTLVFLAFQHSAFSEDLSGIAEPENCAIVLAVAAEGVQIYESKPNLAGGFQWSLKAPEAELKSVSGQVLGKHGAGPSW